MLVDAYTVDIIFDSLFCSGDKNMHRGDKNMGCTQTLLVKSF